MLFAQSMQISVWFCPHQFTAAPLGSSSCSSHPSTSCFKISAFRQTVRSYHVAFSVFGCHAPPGNSTWYCLWSHFFTGAHPELHGSVCHQLCILPAPAQPSSSGRGSASSCRQPDDAGLSWFGGSVHVATDYALLGSIEWGFVCGRSLFSELPVAVFRLVWSLKDSRGQARLFYVHSVLLLAWVFIFWWTASWCGLRISRFQHRLNYHLHLFREFRATWTID